MPLQNIQLSNNNSIEEIANQARQILKEQGFEIIEEDLRRPWGGYFKISDSQIEKFIREYFSDAKIPNTHFNLSPKFMFWAPGGRLSWQVHDKRLELWKVVKGPAGVFLSETDQQPNQPEIFQQGDTISMKQGTRHRSSGLPNWAIIAEIWVHTNPDELSDEADIRRISDDYGR